MLYTLMNADYEVLQFEAGRTYNDIRFIKALEGINAAPIYFDKRAPGAGLANFISTRMISTGRHDAKDILSALGMESPLELSLRAYGLSLTDCYWYRPQGCTLKWKDVSCFGRKWDTRFGEAILSRDYDLLKKADPLTPDCTLGGITTKAWLQKNGRPVMLKAENCEDAFITRAELLSAQLAKRLLDENDRVDYRQEQFAGRRFIACDCMISDNEEFVPAQQLISLLGWKNGYDTFKQISKDSKLLKEFTDKAVSLGVSGTAAYFAKIAIVFNLSLGGDSHFMNFGFIRDLDTLKLRTAPLFDRGRSFGSFGEPIENGCISVKKYALTTPKTLFLIMLLFSTICRPEWDYSWFEPKRLEGFTQEIADTLSGCEEATDEFIKLLQQAFEYQLDYVCKAAEKSRCVPRTD